MRITCYFIEIFTVQILYVIQGFLWHHFDGFIVMEHIGYIKVLWDFLSGLHQHPPSEPDTLGHF